jgi:Flp pilus assembly pilin Flp
MGRTIMHRWVLHRYTVAGIRLRGSTDRLTGRLSARAEARSDRGQTSFEYLGIAVVVAVIIGVLAGTTDIGTKIKDAITSTIDRITSGGGK